jgi:hypothetical protein
VNISLIKKQLIPIRGLTGFNKKTHRIPEKADDWAEKQVAQITEDEVKADLNLIFQRLRKEFGLRRAEMKVSQEQGTGAIDTPYFQYSVVVCVNPDKPSEVVWQRQITDIRERVQVLSQQFERVFVEIFDTVEYFPQTSVSIDEVIDRIEELEDDRITLDYDIDATECTLEMEGLDGVVEVKPSSISLTQSSDVSPKDLLQSFLEM